MFIFNFLILYRLLTAESYQAFSMDKENHDKLSQKEKQKQLKEWCKKSKPFCKRQIPNLKADFVLRLFLQRYLDSLQKVL